MDLSQLSDAELDSLIASQSNAPLSVRNNNPGNIRSGPNGFKQFASPQEGLQAMQADLNAKVTGNSRAMASRFGQGYTPTIRSVISTYVPPTENDTGSYINHVARSTGLSPDAPLTPDHIPLIQSAMIEQEGGKAAAQYYGQASNPLSSLSDEELEAQIASLSPQPEPTEVAPVTQTAQLQQAFEAKKSGLGRTIFDQAMQGATFGFADEISNAIGALGAGAVLGRNPADLVPEAAQISSAELSGQLKDRPLTSIAANLVGGLTTGGIGATTKAGTALTNSLRNGSLAARSGKAALSGAASGGVYGFGSGEADSRLSSAGSGAVLGAAIGGAIPVAGAGLRALNTKTIIPNADTIRKKGAELYEIADQHGGGFDERFTDNLINKLNSVLPQTVEGATVAGKSVVNEIAERFSQLTGKPLSLKGIHEIDKFLGAKVQALMKAGEDGQAYGIRSMQGILRDMVSDPNNNLFLRGTREGIDAVNEGRKLFSASYKLDDIEDIIRYADTYASPATAIKTGFRKLAKDAERLGYSPEEIKLIDEASRTGVVSDLMATFGSRLGAIAGGASGGLGGAILGYGTSAASRFGATSSQVSKANKVAKKIAERTGLVREEQRISKDKLQQVFQLRKVTPEVAAPAEKQLLLAAPDKMSGVPMTEKQILQAQALLRKGNGLTGGVKNIDPKTGLPVGDTSGGAKFGFTPSQVKTLIKAEPSQQRAVQSFRDKVGPDWDKITASEQKNIEDQVKRMWQSNKENAASVVAKADYNAKTLAKETGESAPETDLAEALRKALKKSSQMDNLEKQFQSRKAKK